MTTPREAAQQALEALENGKRVRACEGGTKFQIPLEDNAIAALRAALAQQEEPVAEIIESEIKVDSHQTLDDAMRLPRAMAQAYENGYKAGVAAEREECAKVCDFHVARLSAIDEPRPALAVGICAAAIRARGNT